MLQRAIVALAIAGAPVGATAMAAGHVAISINGGDIAFGYADGYWDRVHQWHPWANRVDADWYRRHYRSHYYAHSHDHDRDEGWRHEWWHR